MTLDDVNTALAGRDESDVPLNDNYWKVLNAFRVKKAEESEAVEIIRDDVGELKVEELFPEPIAEPVADQDLDNFLKSL